MKVNYVSRKNNMWKPINNFQFDSSNTQREIKYMIKMLQCHLSNNISFKMLSKPSKLVQTKFQWMLLQRKIVRVIPDFPFMCVLENKIHSEQGFWLNLHFGTINVSTEL